MPEAGYRELRRVLGVRVAGESSSKKEIPYPDNLIRALKIEGLNAEIMTEDQKSGLEVAIGQLKDKQQKVIRMKYGSHMKNDEIGAVMNRAAGTIGTYHTKALGKLRWPRIAEWYIKGYSKCLPGCLVSRGHAALAAQAVRQLTFGPLAPKYAAR
jgi:DNA-directed RNA polymerase specialized sigma24 family protein